MSEIAFYTYPAAPTYPSEENQCSTLVRLATLGAVVGGAAAAASNLRALRAERVEAGQAVIDTARTALATAVASAVGGAAAGVVAEQGVVRLGMMFAAGTAVMYGLGRRMEGGGDES
ncbi:hypothetical protein [Endothiovibrio diazotrophicus]